MHYAISHPLNSAMIDVQSLYEIDPILHANVLIISFPCMLKVGRDREGWAVRSKAALLLALVAKRQGPSMVQDLLPQLLTIATESPTHTEMVRPPRPSSAQHEGLMHCTLP